MIPDSFSGSSAVTLTITSAFFASDAPTNRDRTSSSLPRKTLLPEDSANQPDDRLLNLVSWPKPPAGQSETLPLLSKLTQPLAYHLFIARNTLLGSLEEPIRA